MMISPFLTILLFNQKLHVEYCAGEVIQPDAVTSIYYGKQRVWRKKTVAWDLHPSISSKARWIPVVEPKGHILKLVNKLGHSKSTTLRLPTYTPNHLVVGRTSFCFVNDDGATRKYEPEDIVKWFSWFDLWYVEVSKPHYAILKNTFQSGYPLFYLSNGNWLSLGVSCNSAKANRFCFREFRGVKCIRTYFRKMGEPCENLDILGTMSDSIDWIALSTNSWKGVTHSSEESTTYLVNLRGNKIVLRRISSSTGSENEFIFDCRPDL